MRARWYPADRTVLPQLAAFVALLCMVIGLPVVGLGNWTDVGAPLVADIDPTRAGLETATLLQGYGWVLWSEEGQVLWVTAASDVESRMPIWGLAAWDHDGDGNDEILVASEAADGSRQLSVLNEYGELVLPGGSSGPTADKLTSLTGLPIPCDVDGDGDTDFVQATSDGQVRASDDYELLVGNELFTLAVATSAVWIEACDLTGSVGDEVVIAFNEASGGQVSVLAYDPPSDPVIVDLPVQPTPLSSISWPPSPAEAGTGQNLGRFRIQRGRARAKA